MIFLYCASSIRCHQAMDRPSIYQTLNDKGAILSVFKDQVGILKPDDPWLAIGTYDLDGFSCLLVLGTTPGSAILVARINTLSDGYVNGSHVSLRDSQSALRRDEHYMSLVRKVISVMLSNPKLFQLPIVYGFFGQHGSEVPLEQFRDSTKVFRHLGIEMRSFLYPMSSLDATQWSSERSSVVAVHHSTTLSELYIGDRLAYPARSSGCLASIFERLGFEKVEQIIGNSVSMSIKDSGNGGTEED